MNGPRGMFDTACRKCGKRYGWAGGPSDCPPCPKCGAAPNKAAVDSDANMIRESFRLLNTDYRKASPEDRKAMREQAGLTVDQASRLAQVPAMFIDRYEAGTMTPSVLASRILDAMFKGNPIPEIEDLTNE